MPRSAQKTDHRPAEHLEIDNLETMRVLSDPLRLEIIQSLMTPCTVKSLATSLNVAPTKLYYHVKLLEEHGIVRVVSTRVVSGIIEKNYGLTAYSFAAKPGLVSAQGNANGVLTVHDGILESARLELRRAHNADLIGPTNAEFTDCDKITRKVVLGRMNGTFTEAQAREFQERLEKLIRDMGDGQRTRHSDDTDAEVYTCTIVFHRTVDPHPKTTGKAASGLTANGKSLERERRRHERPRDQPDRPRPD